MGFLFGNKKEEIVAIFDIGSGSIAGAIVQIPKEEGNLPVILKSIRTEIDYNKDKLDTNVFIRNMLKTLENVSHDLYLMKVASPKKIFCVIASPWYSSETRILKTTKDSEFVFTSKIADDLLQKEIKQILDFNNKKNKSIYSELEIIDSQVMSVALNGYQVSSPIGMKTKSVEMNLIVSSAQKYFLDKLRKVISKDFHDTPVIFSSFMVASYLAIRDKYISPDSYLILDIGGEITEVGIVSRGSLKSSLSFPFGKKTIFRYISTKMEIDLRDAKELFSLYNDNNLSENKKKELDPLFKSIENSWSESFRNCISLLPHVLALPSTIFLTADNDAIKWFKNVISNEEFIQSMTLLHKCMVIPLNGGEFIKMCKFEDKSNCDPFLMIEAISITRSKFK